MKAIPALSIMEKEITVGILNICLAAHWPDMLLIIEKAISELFSLKKVWIFQLLQVQWWTQVPATY